MRQSHISVAALLALLFGSGMAVGFPGKSSRLGPRSKRPPSHSIQAACPEPEFAPQFQLTTSYPSAVVAADLNHDGVPDLATTNILVPGGPGATVTVFLGDGTEAFGPPSTYETLTQPGGMAVADFNRDGNLDFAVAGTGSVSILLGDGTGALAEHSTIVVPDPAGPAAADLDGDGNPDLAIANFFESTVTVLLGNGDGFFDPPVTYAVGTQPQFVGAGDLDADGVPDLAVVNNYDTTVSILLGIGDGTFGSQSLVIVPGGNDLRSLALVDLDDDGNLDMAVINAFINSVALFLGAGDGSFGPPALYTVGGQPHRIDAADFNDDGWVDLGVVNANDGTVSILLGNGDGTLGPEFTFQAASGASSIAIADLNLDGSPDLAVGNLWADSISILLNACAFVLQCSDLDEDGYGLPGSDLCPGGALEDCDDEDPGSFPGAAELCDGKDNDCDDVVPGDEFDEDRDGVQTCAGDCDDMNPLVYPAASEIFDGEDNDCDGSTDEGLDDDGDGIPDFNDACPRTPAGAGVGSDGCAVCFTQDAAVTLCHCPTGAPNNCQTITVGGNAAENHLAKHAMDHLGPCHDDGV